MPSNEFIVQTIGLNNVIPDARTLVEKLGGQSFAKATTFHSLRKI